MELPPLVTIALYGAIALLNIISLGLLSYAISTYVFSPSSANFMLFNTIWTFLVLVYLVLIPRIAATLYLAIVAVSILAVTTIFWFAGSIALAVYLGGALCGNGTRVCTAYQSLQAATAFGFIIWIIFTVLLVFELMSFFRNGGLKGHANADMSGTQMTSQTSTAPQAAP